MGEACSQGRHLLEHVGGLPRWEGTELVGGGLSAEEIGDLVDHPARGLAAPSHSRSAPRSGRDRLLGAVNRARVLLGLRGQLAHLLLPAQW